jgi:hypothetical protein
VEYQQFGDQESTVQESRSPGVKDMEWQHCRASMHPITPDDHLLRSPEMESWWVDVKLQNFLALRKNFDSDSWEIVCIGGGVTPLTEELTGERKYPFIPRTMMVRPLKKWFSTPTHGTPGWMTLPDFTSAEQREPWSLKSIVKADKALVMHWQKDTVLSHHANSIDLHMFKCSRVPAQVRNQYLQQIGAVGQVRNQPGEDWFERWRASHGGYAVMRR